MKQRIDSVTADLSTSVTDVRRTFGALNVGQLNWKPAEKSWSIAQCIDHLITTHSLYIPLFQRLAVEDPKSTFWERSSPLSGYFGKFLIRSLDPANQKKLRTTQKAYPSSAEIDAGIIDRYADHQTHLIDAIRGIPDSVDPARTVITSPLASAITYSLDDCFTILIYHGTRHFDQARRVVETQGFPL